MDCSDKVIRSKIYKSIRSHIEQFWPNAERKEVAWMHGPANQAFPDFKVCRITPQNVEEPWVYVSIGAWETTKSEPVSNEYFILSPTETPIHVETLAVLTFYLRGHRVQEGQVIDIGREWLENSRMHHFLISVPYPYGQKLEYCRIEDTKTIRFLWLLPITETEAEYAEKYGTEALEQRFDEQAIDVVDPSRTSVV